MTPSAENCNDFRGALHRHLEGEAELLEEASLMGHLTHCPRCRRILLEYSHHIQAHRVLEAGGILDAASAHSMRQILPLEFAHISESIIRKRANQLGMLKFEILQIYLRHLLAGNNFGPGLSPEDLPAALKASLQILNRLETYKESHIIFAEGGVVDLEALRNVLDNPLNSEGEGLEAQLRYVARGLLTSRVLAPKLEELVLHQLGAILEKLGHYQEARQLFLAVAGSPSNKHPHTRALALSSAGVTSFRYLLDFELANEYLTRANELLPGRWTVELNLALFHLWPSNPLRNVELGRNLFVTLSARRRRAGALEDALAFDPVARDIFSNAGCL